MKKSDIHNRAARLGEDLMKVSYRCKDSLRIEAGAVS